ncbi:MAG: deoxyuridine 5'-triphosphate nucleotidohydrolase [Dehalococcoidales bacterium]|nr:deoxyuridine 5'-triphosphate nucleotidohydrolase [Dehalococcoidales bacterium]
MSVLSGSDIRRLLKNSPPLVEGWLNLDEQVQANGFDLTLREVAAMQSGGTIAVSNNERVLADLSPLAFGADGFIELTPGVYMVTYNEIVHLPKNIMALGRPRSSLLRCGVNLGTAVWDAGYEGRSQSLLTVHNPRGFRVQQNARITQLVFMELTGDSEGYNGVYQGENI